MLALCLLSFDHIPDCTPEDTLVEERLSAFEQQTQPSDSQTSLTQSRASPLGFQFPCVDDRKK